MKISRAQTKLIRSLRSRKHRDQEGAFVVEGVRLIEELLAGDWPIELMVTAPGLAGTDRGRRLLEEIRRRAPPWAEASASDLERLADTQSTQGVLAVVRRPTWRISDFRPGPTAALLVFDRIADPGNLGTLLRTAHALGVGWAVALPGSVDPFNAKCVRASAGSIFRLPVSQEPWFEAAAWLRDRGFTILCAESGGEAVPRSGKPEPRFALVLGNEPSGISGEVRRDCDRCVAVELSGNVESLNVAVAGALLLDRLLPIDHPTG